MMASLAMLMMMQLLAGAVLTTAASMNNKPVIGILAQYVYDTNYSYIAASYVKFLECGGARVMPIRSSSSPDELRAIFHSINGVLFPGGGVYLNDSTYEQAGKVIFELAKQANDNGDYFPLWGICLGFEMLGYLAADEDISILTSTDSENLPVPITFTKNAQSSRMYSSFSPDLMKHMSSDDLTFNNHNYGITVHTFDSTPKLNGFYKTLSTSKDRLGIEFVSSMEARDYPFYGIPWHPEKIGFEWTTNETINHSREAVMVMQTTANFFVDEALKSSHVFSGQDQDLIYGYTPTYTGNRSNFEQTYYFYWY